MANSPPQKINKLVGVDHWAYTNVELVECRYRWTIKNAAYFSDELKSPMFAAEHNEHNVKWELSFTWLLNAKQESVPRLSLKLLSSDNKSICCAWNVFVEDRKKNLKRLFASDILNWHPGGSTSVNLPYTMQKLHTSSNDVFRENMLTIVVHIIVANSTQQKTVMVTAETVNCTLSDDLGKLLSDPKFSDLTIIVGDSKIPVHKNILALRSDVFEAIFDHDLEEKKTNQIVIDDFDSSVIRAMLRYIYTGDTPKVSQMAGELLRAADKYNLKDLKKACISELYSNLTVETAVHALVVADLHSIDQLKRLTIKFINAHSSVISKTDAFLDLMKNYPHIVRDIFGSQQFSG